MTTLTAAHVTKSKNGTAVTRLYKNGKYIATISPKGLYVPKELPNGSIWRIRLASALAAK